VQALVAARAKMMVSVPADSISIADQLLSDLTSELERLQFAVDRKDAGKTSDAVANALRTVSKLEILQVRDSCVSC
jgi:hypothetical protein